MKHISPVVLMIFTVAGCATQPISRETAVPIPPDRTSAFLAYSNNDDASVAVFLRDTGFVGGGAKAILSIDGEDVAQFKTGEVFTTKIKPGEHVLKVRNSIGSGSSLGSTPQTIIVDFKSKGNYQFRIGWFAADRLQIERTQ